MDKGRPEEHLLVRRRNESFKLGGLEFIVSQQEYGANLAIWGDVRGKHVELIRFQDYVDDPHYHAPVGGWYSTNRAERGEALVWWMEMLRNDLPGFLAEAGFEELVPLIDFAEINANADAIEEAMSTCIPEGYTRDPGYGFRRVDWTTDESHFHKRNEVTLTYGGCEFYIFMDRDLGVSMQIFYVGDGRRIEMIRLDDYDENPHYHAPVGVGFGFDRERLGEPLAWFIAQIRDEFPALLEKAGYASLIPGIDFDEITANASVLYDAMAARVPESLERIPGIGLRRLSA